MRGQYLSRMKRGRTGRTTEAGTTTFRDKEVVATAV